MRAIKINVLRKHIKAGKPDRMNACPIALALRDKGFIAPKVNLLSIRCKTSKRKPIYMSISDRMERFIRRFDEGKTVKPFSFQLKDLSL